MLVCTSVNLRGQANSQMDKNISAKRIYSTGLSNPVYHFMFTKLWLSPQGNVFLVLVYLCLFNYCVQEAELVIRIRILRMRNVKCLRQSFSKFSELPPLFHENFSWLRRVRSAIIWHQVKSSLRVCWWGFIVVHWSLGKYRKYVQRRPYISRWTGWWGAWRRPCPCKTAAVDRSRKLLRGASNV